MGKVAVADDSDAVVRFDLAGLLQQVESQVQKAEVIVRVGRSVRRIGNDLARIAGEIEGETGSFGELGIDSRKLVTQIRRVAGEILASSMMPIEETKKQLDLLATMIRYGQGIDREILRRAQELTERWDELTPDLNAILVKGGNWDLPFAVRVERGSEEIWVGRESGTTYWHNLRSSAIKLWGRFSEEDNSHWLDAKRRLGDGESPVHEGEWVFFRE